MYYMLTGKVPVSALERESETASRKMQENLNRISPALAEVLEKGMALQPGRPLFGFYGLFACLERGSADGKRATKD